MPDDRLAKNSRKIVGDLLGSIIVVGGRPSET